MIRRSLSLLPILLQAERECPSVSLTIGGVPVPVATLEEAAEAIIASKVPYHFECAVSDPNLLKRAAADFPGERTDRAARRGRR